MDLGDPYCDHCHVEIETNIHVPRDYPLGTSLWMALVRPEWRSDFFVGDYSNWVPLNMGNTTLVSGDLSWSSIWATSCHSLWNWRNKEAHDPSFIRPFRPW